MREEVLQGISIKSFCYVRRNLGFNPIQLNIGAPNIQQDRVNEKLKRIDLRNYFLNIFKF